jgi:uncharacterized protein
MTSTDKGIEPAAARVAPAVPAAPPVTASGLAWGNSGPLALAGFATTTFMLSLIDANLVPAGTLPIVFAVAFMFGGLAQFIAGIVQLRIGNTFGGVLFCGFGAFWLSLFAFAEFFVKDVPLIQLGHAQGLFLYAFGIFAAVMLLASFRTNVVVVSALLLLVAALFLIGAGDYTASPSLIKAGGWVALVLAALAFYLALAELCEASYGREVLPVGHLAKK